MLAILAGSSLTLPAAAQTPSPFDLQWGFALQPRLSYATSANDTTERVGFGLRRARLRGTILHRQKTGIQIQMDFAGGVASVVDLFLLYRLDPRWTFRLGHMPSAQPRGYIFTPFHTVDSIERIAINDRWARSTIGGTGRDTGIEAAFQDARNRLVLFVHNGDGNLSNLRGNFREGIGPLRATAGVDTRGIAISGFASRTFEQLPGLEIGGYASYNASRNPNTARSSEEPGRTVTSYTAHAYWGALPFSQPVRLKAEVMGMHFGEEPGTTEQDVFGWSGMGMIRLAKGAEWIAGVEQLWLERGQDPNLYLQTGISLSPSWRRDEPFLRERIHLIYMYGENTGLNDDAQHLIVLQFQVAFW